MSPIPRRLVALTAALALAAASCEGQDPPAGGIGQIGLRLGGSGLSDEWRSLRAVAFDLARQGCVGPRVADPGATPLATTGLAHPDALRVTLSVPAGARTIYVEVYRDADGLDLLGTGCAEAVLSPGENATLHVEIVLLAGDADADADADEDGAVETDADGEVVSEDVDDVDVDGVDEADEAAAEDVAEVGDAPPSPRLVLSELDYDQDSTDTMEFIEVYNASADPIDCAGLELRLVNGVGPAVYLTQPLGCSSIPAGSVHVLGSSALLASVACPSSEVLGSGGNNLIQNGPGATGDPGDGAALVDTSSGSPVVLDQIVYEAAVAGWGEGVFAGEEATSAVSLQRVPAGNDTDDNAADFLPRAPTPCALP